MDPVAKPYFYYHSEMSLQPRLCNLQELLQIPAVAILFFFFLFPCGGVYKPRRGEITFAPRLARTAAGVAIWQSHQEHFTCLTFTCLHAVNKTSLLSVDEPPRAPPGDTGRGERGGQRWKRAKAKLGNWAFIASITQRVAASPSMCVMFTIFSKFKFR